MGRILPFPLYFWRALTGYSLPNRLGGMFRKASPEIQCRNCKKQTALQTSVQGLCPLCHLSAIGATVKLATRQLETELFFPQNSHEPAEPQGQSPRSLEQVSQSCWVCHGSGGQRSGGGGVQACRACGGSGKARR